MQVPHFPQSSPGACLPACVRMVLVGLGDHYSEANLAKTMGSYPFGTPARFVTRIETLGYNVIYDSMRVEELENYLADGHSPIVFVLADFLPWADFSGLHALVITEMSVNSIWVHDPDQASGPMIISPDEFLLAWEEFDSRAAVITK